MNLAQAYQGWQQQAQNRELYTKTREAFRKAWFTLPTNKPCSYYTKEVLGTALAATREVESNKAKAASVMVHVLTFANWAEPKFNPKPDFDYHDLMEYTKGPLADPDKIKPAEKPSCLDDYDDNDLDIDPVTAAPRKAMEQEAQPSDTEGTGICCDVPAPADVTEVPVPDVSPAPESGTAAEESETKTNEDMEPKKTRGRQPKPVAQIDPNTLQVIKEWPSMSEATKELNLCHVEVAISKLRKAGGFYWSLAEDADTFKDRLAEKQRLADERQKQQAEKMREKKASQPKTEKKPKKLQNPMHILKSKEKIERLSRNLDDRPIEPVQSAAVVQQPSSSAIPSDHQRTAAAAALAVFTDDELLEELDRRGWQGELRRTQVISIGR